MSSPTYNQLDKKLIDLIEDTLDVTLNIATDSEVMGHVLTIASMLLAINAWKRGKNMLGIRLLETGWVVIPSLLPQIIFLFIMKKPCLNPENNS
jgi:hypothetical protein